MAGILLTLDYVCRLDVYTGTRYTTVLVVPGIYHTWCIFTWYITMHPIFRATWYTATATEVAGLKYISLHTLPARACAAK